MFLWYFGHFIYLFYVIKFFISFIFFCRTLSGTVGFMRRLGPEDLIPLDWEKEKTLKKIRQGKREAT